LILRCTVRNDASSKDMDDGELRRYRNGRVHCLGSFQMFHGKNTQNPH